MEFPHAPLIFKGTGMAVYVIIIAEGIVSRVLSCSFNINYFIRCNYSELRLFFNKEDDIYIRENRLLKGKNQKYILPLLYGPYFRNLNLMRENFPL